MHFTMSLISFPVAAERPLWEGKCHTAKLISETIKTRLCAHRLDLEQNKTQNTNYTFHESEGALSISHFILLFEQ